MTKLLTLEAAVTRIVIKAGGIRAAARVTGVDKGFIHRLMSGKKVNPSDETLVRLGLVPVARYEVAASARAIEKALRAGADSTMGEP